MSLSRRLLTEFVAARVAERIGADVADDHDSDLFELGLDSVDAVELTGEIEERFGIEIDPGLAFEARSINRLADSLADAVQRPL